jgi:succinoglycan biosynthesis protein ExoO
MQFWPTNPVEEITLSISASVLIPVHNGVAFVERAIASALAQTCRDVEVIVVDDGSTDGSWEMVTACAHRDARVVPIRQPERGGPAAARNAAITRARGRWLALLDADDLFLPERLERLIGQAEGLGADLLADNLLEQDFETGAVLGRHFSDTAMGHSGPVPLAELVRRGMPDPPERGNIGYAQPIIRREFLSRHGIRYAEDIRVGEDLLLLFECVARGARLHLTPEAYYLYRLRQGSISHRRDGTLFLSAANRRMLGLARTLGDAEVVALLRRRQRLIDFHSFALEMQRGRYWAALGYAHCVPPARPWRQLRVAIGATRQRLFGTSQEG